MTPACWTWPVPIGPQPNHLGSVSRWQARRCAVCGSSPAALYEDHDHGTGLTRGYLCPSCNAGEGLSSREVFRWYRERSPASILGVRVRYRTQVGHPDDQAARNRWEAALETLAEYRVAVERYPGSIAVCAFLGQEPGPPPEVVVTPLMAAAERVGLTQREWFARHRR